MALDNDLEVNLRQWLVATLPGGLVDERIFPAPAPQNSVAPYITFQRISTERVYSFDGYSKLAGALVQIDCWSDAPEYAGSYAEAKNVANEVRKLLVDYRGNFGPVVIQETTIESEHDLFEAQDHTRRVSFDFRFWFEEEPS
jgi:uncharacterized protein DUF3168